MKSGPVELPPPLPSNPPPHLSVFYEAVPRVRDVTGRGSLTSQTAGELNWRAHTADIVHGQLCVSQSGSGRARHWTGGQDRTTGQNGGTERQDTAGGQEGKDRTG